jgi:hypothetical protein
MAPVYDIYTLLKHEIYTTTEDEIIKIAKKRFYEEVNNRFRDGVEETTGKEFKLEKIDKYDIEYYQSLWNTCDTRTTYTLPYGPAILERYEIDLLEENKDKSEPLNKKLIFSLPISKCNNVVKILIVEYVYVNHVNFIVDVKK